MPAALTGGAFRAGGRTHLPPRTADSRTRDARISQRAAWGIRYGRRRRLTSPQPDRVDRVHPQYGLRLLHRLDVEIDRDGLTVAAHQHALQNLVRAGIDLLMRHVRRDEDEIAGIGLGRELQMLAPAHPRPAANHVDDAFKMAVMVGAGFASGLIVTVPAHSFCAPVRAKLMAAFRSIPAVEGTLGSN